jgi:hypothetical protein
VIFRDRERREEVSDGFALFRHDRAPLGMAVEVLAVLLRLIDEDAPRWRESM